MVASFTWHGQERRRERLGQDETKRRQVLALVKANAGRIARANGPVELYAGRLVVVAAPTQDGARVVTVYERGPGR